MSSDRREAELRVIKAAWMYALGTNPDEGNDLDDELRVSLAALAAAAQDHDV